MPHLPYSPIAASRSTRSTLLPRMPLGRPKAVLTLVLSLTAVFLLLHPASSPILGQRSGTAFGSSSLDSLTDSGSSSDGLQFLHPHEEEQGHGDWGVGKWLPGTKSKPLLLVTGGAGQLGQALLPKLSLAYTIHILDVLPRPADLPQGTIYHRGSVLPPSNALPSLFSSYSFSGVLHLAAVSLDAWCAAKEAECMAVNEGGTKALMAQVEAAGSAGWRKRPTPWVILASSMDVLGDGTDERAPRHPQSALGRTKAKAEEALEASLDNVSGHGAILRFADIYGYTRSAIPQSFMPSLLSHALTSTPIQYDSSAQPLDLTHIDDIVEGVALAVQRVHSGTGLEFETIHLVSGKSWTESELVERVRKVSTTASPVRDIGSNKAPQAVEFSTSLSAELLEWYAATTLAEGIRRSLAGLTESVTAYAHSYHAENCAPSPSLPSLTGHHSSTRPDERNKALWKLDGCLVQLGFENDGYIHHVKCEDGKHCGADGIYVKSYNWNATYFTVRGGGEQRDRRAKLRFQEENGDRFLGIPKGADRVFGEVDWELVDGTGRPAYTEFDVEVAPDNSYLRLMLENGKQVHAIANASAESTWFSLNEVDHLGNKHYDMRLTVVCCPYEGDWPLLLDDHETADTRFGSTGQIPFNASRRLHTCQRAEQAVRYNTQLVTEFQKTAKKSGDGQAALPLSEMPHDWALLDLPTCWNDCDSPTVCVQTGKCRCVESDCPPKRDSPLLALKRPSLAATSLGALGVKHSVLVEATEKMDWKDVLLPDARRYIAANPGFIKVHVLGSYEGEAEVEAATCHKLGDRHCFSADNILYRAMRHIGGDHQDADLVVLPVYQQCHDAEFMLHTLMHHATMTVPGVKEGTKRLGVVLTHDWGICVSFNWEIWSARAEPMIPDWILANTLVMSVMGDYDSPCYRPYQDVVIPARSCQTYALREAFPTIESIKPMRERTNLVTWAGTYWGTGKNERLRLTCPRGGAGDAELVPGGGKQSNWYSWNYMNDLANARFCPQPRGIAGWSPRLNDAIFAGCIPVIIAEGTHYPFADFIDWSKISVRLAATELDKVEQILGDIPLERVEEIQANLALVREAFLYAGDEAPEEEIGRRGPMWFALHEAGMRLRTRYPTRG